MNDADALFDSFASRMVGSGATTASMFGKRSLTIHGKAFVCLKGEFLAFRLGAGTAQHEEALALTDAGLFDPSGKGRPFKDWVAVPLAQADQWPQFAEAARRHTTSGSLQK